MLKGGGKDLTRSTGQVKSGDVEAQKRTFNLRALKAEQARAEAAMLRELQDKVESELRNNAKLAQFSSQIKLDMTRDGLRIQIVDEQNRPMFDSGSAAVKPYMRELLQAIGSVLSEVPNRLTLGRPHRRPAVFRRRARLQQLGAQCRPRQRQPA